MTGQGIWNPSRQKMEIMKGFYICTLFKSTIYWAKSEWNTCHMISLLWKNKISEKSPQAIRVFFFPQNFKTEKFLFIKVTQNDTHRCEWEPLGGFYLFATCVRFLWPEKDTFLHYLYNHYKWNILVKFNTKWDTYFQVLLNWHIHSTKLSEQHWFS